MKPFRRGSSLLEVLVLITLISVALTAAATTLVALLRIERQVRTDQSQRQCLASLASRWRTDAHAATAASVNEDCVLTLADGRTIRYFYAMPRVVREVRRGDEIVHRDAFVLSPRAQIAFSESGDAPPYLVTLSISAVTEPGPAYAEAICPAAFEAVVNLHGGAAPEETTP
jgi:type II secretory pathway pseudopilin PulG